MTDEEAVNLYADGQICFAFIRAVKNHRRMMERREIEVSEVDVEIGLFVRCGEPFVKHFLPHGRFIKDDSYCNQQ